MFIGSSNFLEEISSLSHSIVFFYFFALIAEEGFLISPCYSLELCIQVGISSIQSPSCVWLFGTPWTAALQASLSITNFRSLLKLMSIELVMRSNHLILCRPLLLPPSIFPSMRVFSNELVLCISWPEYSNFSFNISLFKVYSRLIFVGSPCCPRDSQESSPPPQFKSINSSVLSFLYSPPLTSIHD